MMHFVECGENEFCVLVFLIKEEVFFIKEEVFLQYIRIWIRERYFYRKKGDGYKERHWLQ